MSDNVLCNDPNGLCVAVRGDGMNPKTSGVYTSLFKLASQLTTNTTTAGGGGGGDDETPQRLVLETTSSTIHVKEYEGHVVAVKVMKSTSSSSTTTTTSTTTTPTPTAASNLTRKMETTTIQS